MKHSYLIFLILSVTFNLFSQTKQVELTKEQMYEDFDLFYDIIKDVNPQLVARQKVTGIDILNEILKQRSLIDTLTNQDYFFDILDNALIKCNDGHTLAIKDSFLLTKIFNNDTLKVSNLCQQYRKTKPIQNFAKYIKYISAFYDNGNYYRGLLKISFYILIFQQSRSPLKLCQKIAAKIQLYF